MAQTSLKQLKVAVLVTEGFEQQELTSPVQALREQGAQVSIVSPDGGHVQAWVHFNKGERFAVDVPLSRATPDDFDALLLPGGVANPDRLRTLPAAVQFVRRMAERGAPIAAICHGPWMLIEADAVQDRHVTSWPSLKTDLTNAGAHWSDQPVVVDGNLVTSRKPDDLPAFNREMLQMFRQRGIEQGAKEGGRFA